MMNRRDFLIVGATAAGGLVIGRILPTLAAAAGSTRLTPFIEIDVDGTIILYSPKPDVGTGTLTSLPMLVAEELEADWGRVVVRQAPIDAAYGDQGVGGSDSVMSAYDDLRRAGAVGRTLLVRAAAERWSVPADACRANRSVVANLRSGATLSYGELAAAAARQPLPDPLPVLKPRAAMTLVGTRRTGPALVDVVNGSAVYGIDVRLPGMLYAVIQKCPVFGGRVARVDDRAALQVPGVRRVFVLDGATEHIWLRPGVAVVADTTWAAIRGREALRIEWHDGDGRDESSERLRARFETFDARPPAKLLRQSGDVDAGLAQAARTIDVTYELPFLAHVPMEPVNCTAHVDGTSCRIWGPIQLPAKARNVVASVLGMPKESIVVTVTRIGGAFGRRLLSDYAAEAATISRLAGTPIHVVWTREDDVAHDYFRPAARHRVRAGLDASGRVTTWDHHVIGTPNDAYPGDAESDGLFAPRSADATRDFEEGLTPKLIANYRLGVTTVRTPIQTGSLRAPGWNAGTFVVESVIDELARAGGIDPIELRLRMIGDTRDFPVAGERRRGYYDPARLRRVLEALAERAGSPPRTAGVGRGLAGHFSMSSYAAHAIDVTVGQDRVVRIRRVVSVVDCGIVVNPSGVEAQIQSAVIDGLSAALFGEVRVENGGAVPRNFDSYRILRNREIPPIELHVIDSDRPPTGIGEIPYPAVAPALTNAIFDACGTRIRRLPVTASGFTFEA